MAVIPYVAQTWTDGVSSASAARMLVLENGISEVSLAPAVRVYHNATQSITTATETALSFNSERFDQVAGAASTQHDTVTNNTRLTCRYAGVYHIIGNAGFSGNATGVRIYQIRLNGATEIARAESTGSTAYNSVQTVATLYVLAVNDYVELTVTQNSGGSLATLQAGNYSPEFMMVRVG